MELAQTGSETARLRHSRFVRRVSCMGQIGRAQILIVETRVKTSGNWGRNRRNLGGTIVRNGGGTELETGVEIKAD